MRRLFLPLLLIPLLPATAGAETLVTRYDLESGIGETVLENGLTLLTLERHSVPIVSVQIWYRVGSADEPRGATGVAHLLEHMMFKGTDRYGKGEIDRITLKLGGRNNAATFKDWTCFYFDFAADRWETALAIESNRMRHLALDPGEFEAERKVVLEELMMGRDAPWGELDETIESIAFLAHPYRHPVIGFRSDVERVPLSTVREFYDRYYVSNNAVLVLVGDFDTRRAVERVAERFGPIPRGPSIPERREVEPEQNGERRVLVRRCTELRRLEVIYHTVPESHPDAAVLDVIGGILAGSRSSRLLQRFVEAEGAVTLVAASSDTRRDPGLFWIWTELRPQTDPEKMEGALLEEIGRLSRENVPPEELARVKKKLVADLVFRRATTGSTAEDIGRLAVTADWRLFGRTADRIRAVTATGVRRVASRYLTAKNRTVGQAWPEGTGRGSRKPPVARRGRREGRAPGGPRVLLDPIVRVLPNGLTLIVLQNTAAPVLALRAHVDAGRLREALPGLGHVTGRALLLGTGELDTKALAEAFDALGAGVSATGTGLTVRCLSEDAALAIPLVADVLRNPTFPAPDLEKLRGRVLSELKAENDDPETLALRTADRLIYGNHPYAHPERGRPESLARLSREDVIAHHRRCYVPGNTVIAAVSDRPPEEIIDLLEASFEDWEGAAPDFPQPPAIEPAEARTETVVRETDQTHVCLGHLGIRRDDPDYYALLVMDYVLGMGPGFTDRLSRTLRDRDGLAYIVYATITRSARIEPGRFLAYVATSASQRDRAIRGIRAEIERIRKEPVTEEEISDAKAYLTGSFVFGYETAEQLAERLVRLHRLGLGFDYPKRFAKRVNEVTREDVLRVARRHLHPERLVTVLVGPSD